MTPRARDAQAPSPERPEPAAEKVGPASCAGDVQDLAPRANEVASLPELARVVERALMFRSRVVPARSTSGRFLLTADPDVP